MPTSTPPNILVLMTDQQRMPMLWNGWQTNLTSFARLAKYGLTFNNAFAGAAMCSPSRATLWTSRYPQQTNVLSTDSTQIDQTTLPPTLGAVLAKAGYQTAYRGKWHLGNQANNEPPAFGFGTWDPPDSGTSTQAGPTDGYENDPRYVNDINNYLTSYSGGAPFFLVASLVNPHDICFASEFLNGQSWNTQNWGNYGTPSTWANLPIPVPTSTGESLQDKPDIQGAYRTATQQPNWTAAQCQAYVQFYAYLQQYVDAQINQILDTLENAGLTESTLIVRLADHGDMGLSHGLIEKTFNAYEETIHVPLIFSNPTMFPTAQTTNAFASLADIVPTLADLTGVLGDFPNTFKGQSLMPVLNDPSTSVQSSILYTFDDEALLPPGGDSLPYHIRCLRTDDWKFAAYYSSDFSWFQYELYPVLPQPTFTQETENLAYPGNQTPAIQEQMSSLNTQLVSAMNATATLPTNNWPSDPASQPWGGPGQGARRQR